MREFYALSDEQQAVVDRAAHVVREKVAPLAAATDREARFPRAQMEALGQAGFLGLTLPVALGGLGQGPRTFVAVAETVARGCGSTAMVYLMHVAATNVIAARKLQGGDDLLRRIAAGKHISTLAFSEKGSRSHFWVPMSREVRVGGMSLLTADKSWVTSAGEADSYVISTLAAAGQGPTDSTLFLVDAQRAGLVVPSTFDGLGLRGNASAPMRLEGVEVEESDLVSEPGQGFAAMMDVVLPWFAIGSAANTIGLAEAALGLTIQHLGAAKFEHLGATLGEALPTLRQTVARMRTEIDRARAHLGYTVSAMEAPGTHTMAAVLASKLQAADMALEVTDLGMRACGGAAFSRHLPLERCFRDARAASVMAPTSDVLRELLGKAVLGLPLF
jgi:alkylation response protein AidB-like acyl-CoA dehydrogenase